MEYYLTLIEYLQHAKDFDLDSEDVEDYKAEVEEYIKTAKRQSDYSQYIERIDYLLKTL